MLHDTVSHTISRRADLSRPELHLRPHYAPGLFGFQHTTRRPRAETLADAHAPVLFPELLAKRLNRPRKLADEWLPVPIPDVLAHAYSGHGHPDAGRAFLRRRLAELCAWLDARLEDPPTVIERKGSRLVVVFGSVGYRVDFVNRSVSAVRISPQGLIHEQQIEVELLRPLSTSYWLNWVIEDLHISARAGQLPLFVKANEARLHDQWLTDTAYALLERDPRFRSLRKNSLPEALALNKELLALAVHARYSPWRGRVPRSTFNLVWQHESAFRVVARENPQFLKLLELCLWAKVLPLKGDPVAEIRDYLLAEGFSEVTWRYVHRHGSRLFRIPSTMSTKPGSLEVVRNYLRVLESAGLPPPAPPTFVRAWLRCHVQAGTDRVWFTEHWCKTHPTVLRVLLLEADRRRRDADFTGFVGEAVGIMHWAMEVGLALNKHQARAGWNWLKRHWLTWRDRRRREAERAGKQWFSIVERTTLGSFVLVPLTNGADLVDEAIGMRHCVDSYEADCLNGSMRIFSVRCSDTNKRLATLGIAKREAGDWHTYEVRRYANRTATIEQERLAVTVARLYTESEKAVERDLEAALRDLGDLCRSLGIPTNN